ncbi:transposase, partial [Rhizobium leguminosarum]|nr:transposase [Rhizobium leguminosarum]
MLWQNKNTNYSTRPVDDNHLLSKVNKYIDLSFTHQLVIDSYNSRHGRPSIDPEIFFRMLLISYFYNINSDRRLCQEVRYNVAYRWFCKLALEDKVPDHSYLSKTRNRFGEKVFEALFNTTDSTLIKANASLNSLTPIEAKAAVSEKVARKRVKNKLGLPQSRTISNSTHISKTDKDSSLAKKEGSPRELKYKIHNSIDALSRVIIDTYVTSGKTHDSQVYIERLNHIREKYTLTIKEAIADRAYGSREIIDTLQRQGIVTYIPLFSTKSGKAIQDAYKAGFVYEKEQDRFVCPEGRYLNPYEFIDI